MNKPPYHIDETWVQRYQAGKLTEEEQRWLKENPLEAEALEGLAQTTDWSADIPILQQQLEERTMKRATLWATYGRYAAAVAVLLVSGWLVYQATLPEALTEHVSHEMQSDAPDITEEAPVALTVPERVESEKATSAMSDTQTSPTQKEIKPVPVPQQEAVALLSPAVPADVPVEEIQEETEELVDEDFKGAEADFASPQRSQTQARLVAPMSKSDENADRPVVGIVYSANDQEPIPGVNVLVKGSAVGTTSDLNGQFQITVPDSSRHLVVSSIGYQSQEIAVNQQDSLSVQLEDDVQSLSEVVVIGYGTLEEGSAVSQSAQPLPSQKKFRTYLQNNLQYPEEAQQQRIEGNVLVRFTVQASGVLTNFTIKKSLGYGCDEEAIRLIKAGPRWQPALQNGEFKDQEVTVKVRFRMPTK